MAKLQGKEGLISLCTTVAASSCCLLPLAVVFLGLGRLFRSAVTQGGLMTAEVTVYWSSW